MNRSGDQRAQGTGLRAWPYSYAAFISYRHLPRDTEVARQVQRAIETFRAPRGVVAPGIDATRRLGRCFRDEDELAASPSLPASIQQAIAQSRALIVICTPDTPASAWVQREVETFMQIHGRERIIVVLAAGDTKGGIPEPLRSCPTIAPDDSPIVIPSEPLAADLRPEAHRKHSAELLRVIAAVAGCGYDDLRRRERRRRNIRVAIASIAAVGMIGIIGLLGTTAASSTQEALLAESQALAAESRAQFSRGERMQAIETALAALPSSSADRSRPLVPEAREALEEALLITRDPYELWQPSYTFDASADIATFLSCPNGSWAAAIDESNTLSILDVTTGALLHAIDLGPYSPSDSASPEEWGLAAAGEDKLLLVNRKGTGCVACFDTATGEELWSTRGSLAVDAFALSDDGQQCVLFHIGDESLTAMLIHTQKKGIINSVELENPGLSPLSTYFYPAVYDANANCFYMGDSNTVIAIDFSTNIGRRIPKGDYLVWDLLPLGGDGNPLALASFLPESDNPGFDIPYEVAVSPAESPRSEEPTWRVEGTYDFSFTGPPLQAMAHIEVPKIHGLIAAGEPALAFSAGGKLRVYALSDGREIFRENFNSAILDVYPSVFEEETGVLFFATSDGSLDIRFPLLTPGEHGNVFHTIVPYQLKAADLELHEEASFVALLQPIDQPSRLVAYSLMTDDIHQDEQTATSYSLDELIALAHRTLDAS